MLGRLRKPTTFPQTVAILTKARLQGIGDVGARHPPRCRYRYSSERPEREWVLFVRHGKDATQSANAHPFDSPASDRSQVIRTLIGVPQQPRGNMH